MFFEIAPRRTVGFTVITLLIEAQDGNLDCSVQEFDGLFEKVAVAGGISVGRQAHDLVFVGVEIKTEVQRDHRIEFVDGIVRR